MVCLKYHESQIHSSLRKFRKLWSRQESRGLSLWGISPVLRWGMNDVKLMDDSLEPIPLSTGLWCLWRHWLHLTWFFGPQRLPEHQPHSWRWSDICWMRKIKSIHISILGFPCGSDGKASAQNSGDSGSSLGQEDPWRRTWQPIPELLPRNFHGWRSLVGYSPWGHKELDTTERFHFHISILYMKSKPYI